MSLLKCVSGIHGKRKAKLLRRQEEVEEEL